MEVSIGGKKGSLYRHLERTPATVLAWEGTGITLAFRGFCLLRRMPAVGPYPQRAWLHAQH